MEVPDLGPAGRVGARSILKLQTDYIQLIHITDFISVCLVCRTARPDQTGVIHSQII